MCARGRLWCGVAGKRMFAAGGVRITETELELMALAEYVQELEAALKKDRAKSAGQQPALTTTKGEYRSRTAAPLCSKTDAQAHALTQHYVRRTTTVSFSCAAMLRRICMV